MSLFGGKSNVTRPLRHEGLHRFLFTVSGPPEGTSWARVKRQGIVRSPGISDARVNSADGDNNYPQQVHRC